MPASQLRHPEVPAAEGLLIGEVPVGPDGRASTAIEGRPVLAHTRE